MSNPTIEPEIQEQILNILPDDGPLALKIMCQLLANMIMSINHTKLGWVIAEIKTNLVNYGLKEN
jgi:hypothetical protein